MPSDCDVFFKLHCTQTGHTVGECVLNAPKRLNALNFEMLKALNGQLQLWINDKKVVAIIIRGAGERAFCAGGDVRALQKMVISAEKQSQQRAEQLLAEEYRLDYRLHTCGKPVLCWGSGIVMGGGVGLLAASSHGVVTESSQIAMPEISIGLFPDAGGSWFLGKMPARTGLFVGMSGVHMSASDALFAGLAHHVLDDEDFPRLLTAMLALKWTHAHRDNHRLLSGLLTSMASRLSSPSPSVLQDGAHTISELTCAAEPPQILAGLKTLKGVLWEQAVENMEYGCPLTAWLVIEQLHRARHLSLADMLRRELTMAVHCLRGQNFVEGVRALLVDRDNSPNWNPPTLTDVTPEQVEQHFSALWTAAEHPLADL